MSASFSSPHFSLGAKQKFIQCSYWQIFTRVMANSQLHILSLPPLQVMCVIFFSPITSIYADSLSFRGRQLRFISCPWEPDGPTQLPVNVWNKVFAQSWSLDSICIDPRYAHISAISFNASKLRQLIKGVQMSKRLAWRIPIYYLLNDTLQYFQ